jgi:hypothetical protein
MKPSLLLPLLAVAASSFTASAIGASAPSNSSASATEPSAQPPSSAQAASSHETAHLKVLKVYAANDGEALFRAYVVEWKGQEVIVSDNLVRTDYKVGDTIRVLVMNHPFPRGAEKYRLLSLTVAAAPR